MTQSIESHILGKQRIISTLNSSIPTLIDHPHSEMPVAEELEPIMEMLEVREKIDYCLEKLEYVVNREE